MENLIEITSVPLIVSIVYGALALYKNLVGTHEKLVKIIPVIAAGLGVILGIIAFYAVPDIMAADNIFTAILIGGSSGLAATGTNQIFKQLTKDKNNGSDSNGSKDE